MTLLNIKTLDFRGHDFDNILTFVITFALGAKHMRRATKALVLKLIPAIQNHYGKNRVLWIWT